MNWDSIAQSEIAQSITQYKDWWLAFVAPVAAILISTVARIWVHARDGRKGWALADELLPSTSKLLWIIGFQVFSEIAPLSPQLKVGVDHLLYIAFVIVLLAAFRRALLIAIQWGVSKSQHSKTLEFGFVPLLKNLINIFVIGWGAVMILQRFGYNAFSLLTALGVGSLAVGLAAKETLANMISGFTLILDRNLRTGDRINLSGSIGDVEEIGLRSTRLRLLDGNTLIVPNFDLVNTKILNLTGTANGLECATSIRVAIDAPFTKLSKIGQEAYEHMPEAVRSRKDFGTRLASLSDGHQLVTFRFTAALGADAQAFISLFNEQLIARLGAEKITLQRSPSLFV
jgi:small-conductance mechanosensitive channel